MSLSPFDSFQSQFVTYLLNFPRSVIISSRNFKDLYSVSNLVLSYIIKWFPANNLVLNFDKTNIMKFITKNSSHSALHTG